MQGEVAQCLGLVIFGNQTIREGLRNEFWPTSSVFQYCRRVRFVEQQPWWDLRANKFFASDPVEWFEKLKRRRALGFRIHRLERKTLTVPNRLSAGLVGGGPIWLIEAVYKTSSDLWRPQWCLGDQNDPIREIWNVYYHRGASNVRSLQTKTIGLAAAKTRLGVALESIEKFAAGRDLHEFAATFRHAVTSLGSYEPLASCYLSDLANGDLSLEAQQLIAAADKSWVFGAMGSWNDLGLHGQEKYDAVSERLFLALCDAICEAANSTYGRG